MWTGAMCSEFKFSFTIQFTWLCSRAVRALTHTQLRCRSISSGSPSVLFPVVQKVTFHHKAISAMFCLCCRCISNWFVFLKHSNFECACFLCLQEAGKYRSPPVERVVIPLGFSIRFYCALRGLGYITTEQLCFWERRKWDVASRNLVRMNCC